MREPASQEAGTKTGVDEGADDLQRPRVGVLGPENGRPNGAVGLAVPLLVARHDGMVAVARVGPVLPVGAGVDTEQLDGHPRHCLVQRIRLVDAGLGVHGGRRDPFGSPELVRRWAKRTPESEVHVMTDSGHLPWLDAPAQHGALITDFRARIA